MLTETLTVRENMKASAEDKLPDDQLLAQMVYVATVVFAPTDPRSNVDSPLDATAGHSSSLASTPPRTRSHVLYTSSA